MKFFFAFLFCLLFHPIFSQAQDPKQPSSEIAGDTLEGISTDTSIIYIIKKPPVKIKEKVEIQREKKKKYFYLTLGLSSYVNMNTYRAHSGYSDYVKLLNDATKSQPGLACIFQLYYLPHKNNILGLSVEGKRMAETFRFTPINDQTTNFANSYTYGHVSIILGKWYRKEEKISYQIHAYPMIDYRFGVSGYTLSKADPSNVSYIAEAIAYKKFNLSFCLKAKMLYNTKNSFIEIGPYLHIAPFSMTKKSEAFSITRSALGLYVTLTNKLF